jgi:hypothetical protein
MKTPLALFLTTLTVLAANCPANGAEQGPRSQAGWGVEPSKAASAKVKRDLSALLEPTAEWSHDDQGYEWGFRTRTWPQSTGIQGICFRDELIFDYAVAVPNDDVGPQPAQPIGVRAHRTYHVIDGPIADWGKPSTEDRRRWMADCRSAQADQRIFWFPAGRAIDVARAANAVRVAVAELQAGRLQPKGCNSAADPGACKDLILENAKGFRIVGVHRDCGSGTGEECYAVDLDGNKAFIQVTISASFDENALVPKGIGSISETNRRFELGWWDGIHVDPEPRR